MENKIDDLFKSQLNNLPEELPSEQDWSALKKELNESGLIKNERRKGRFFFWVFGALLISGLAAAAIFIDTPEEQVKIKKDVEQELVVNAQESLHQKNPVKNILENKKDNKEVVLSQKNISIAKKEIKEDQKILFNVPVHATKINSAKAQKAAAKEIPKKFVLENSSEVLAVKEEIVVEVKNETQAAADVLQSMDADKEDSLAQQSETQNITNAADNLADSIAVETLADSISTLAQNDTPAVSTEKKEDVVDEMLYRKLWGGAIFSLDYNNYNLKLNDQLQGSYVLNNDLIHGQQFFQYSAGLGIGYRHSKLLGISAELLYSQKKGVNVYAMSPDSIGSDNYNYYQYNLEAKYLDLIVKPRFYIWNKKFSAYVFPGVVASFNLPGVEGRSYFTKSKITANGYEHDKINLSFFSVGLSLLGGAGIEYDIKNNWKISGEISYRQSLTPVIQHPTYVVPLAHYLYSVNVAAGIYKYF